MTLLLAILQTLALVVLQQPVLAAEMTAAEPTVTDYALRRVLALLEGTADLLGHAAPERKRYVQGGVCG